MVDYWEEFLCKGVYFRKSFVVKFGKIRCFYVVLL